METGEKIKFTLAFILMGWLMLLVLPPLPGETPTSTTTIAIYALVNFYAMYKVHRWIQESQR